MGRRKIAALLSAAMVAAVVPAGTAHAAQASTFTCYPGTAKAFDYTSTAVVDEQVTTTLADGTRLPAGVVARSDPPYYPTKTSGRLIDAFTNQATGKTIRRNDSGTNWFTYDPAPKVPGALATGTFISVGDGADSFGPKSLAALKAVGIREPTLVFVHGLLVMRFVIDADGPYVTDLSLRGTQRNGCALLSGRGGGTGGRPAGGRPG